MNRFKPYRPNPNAWVGALFLIGFGVLMMAAALMPHPSGFTGRAGRYIPLEAVPVYQWFLGLGALVLWGMAAFGAYRRRK